MSRAKTAHPEWTEAAPTCYLPLMDGPGHPADAPQTPPERAGDAGGPQGAKLDAAGKRQRREHRTPAPDVLIPATDVASRTRAWALICKDCAGSRTMPPLPLAVACRLRGIPLRTVEDTIARGDGADLERARASGIALALQKAMTDTENARNWWNLAERLEPKSLHLPTKITGVSHEDGGAPLTLAAAPTRALSRADLLAIAAEATAAAGALPADAGEDGEG